MPQEEAACRHGVGRTDTQTCHRRFQQWAAAGVFAALAEQLLKLKVSDPDLPNLSECFVDATFAPAKKGAIASGRPRKAKAPR
jgi:hypothetical protein